MGIDIPLIPEQRTNLRKLGKTSLRIDQMEQVVTGLCPDADELGQFILKEGKRLQPLSLSLFVINDMVKKLMRRKPRHPHAILPMVTVPWFYWKQSAVDRNNPFGIVRHKNTGVEIELDAKKEMLVFSGTGGDFAGILEAQVAEGVWSSRPLIVPGSLPNRQPVPAYQRKHIKVGVNLGAQRVTLYPKPRRDLDYTFSESPRVFAVHGAEIAGAGQAFRLKTGTRSETALRGNVLMLIGRRPEREQPDAISLTFHIWLAALARLLRTREDIEW